MSDAVFYRDTIWNTQQADVVVVGYWVVCIIVSDSSIDRLGNTENNTALICYIFDIS